VLADAEARDVALAVEGDHEAFERLYRGTVARVYSLARRMAGEQAAEDLTQEVFVRAWEKLSTFRSEAGFGTWLHRLAVNLILSRRKTMHRRRQRFLPTSDALALVAAPRPSPGLALDIEAGLQRLPEGARTVLVLYDMEGFSHEEIARRMGISVGTSKSQLHRARMILRDYLN
jgi:RNA polymerase sigma-70 factor (ECF subfamily)